MIGFFIFSILTLFECESITQVLSGPDLVQNDGNHFRLVNSFLHNA